MAEIDLLLDALDQAYDRRAWHGTNLRGSLRGMTAEQAAWRPAQGRHNVWELALHAAYWKYVACYRILGGKRGRSPARAATSSPGPKESPAKKPGKPTSPSWAGTTASSAPRSPRSILPASTKKRKPGPSEKPS